MAKKVNKTEENVVEQPANLKISQAVKHYIWEHASSKSIQELADEADITKEDVKEILSSRELDKEPVVEHNQKKANAIRRFLVKEGSVAMTAAQAALENLTLVNELKIKDNFEKKYGKCIGKIEVRE